MRFLRLPFDLVAGFVLMFAIMYILFSEESK